MKRYAFSHVLEKVAVDLPMLRKATQAVKNRLPIFRRQIEMGVDGTVRTVNRATEMGMSAAGFPDISPKKIREFGNMVKAEVDNPALAETVGKAFDSIEKLKPGIYQAGDQGKAMADVGLIDPIISPTSKEVFNRSVMLHEAREVGKHPGVFRFASHNSLTPMLQDLNIAATLKGPGVDDAVLAIRQMRRPEVEGLKMTVPDVGRLNLGEQRLSRHAQKRLQEAYDRALFSGAERRGQTPVQSMIFPRTDATKLYRKKMSKS